MLLRRNKYPEAPVAGVYIVHGPNGVYVGESVDCFYRHDLPTLLGWDWGVVHEFPLGATLTDRRRAETLVADAWAARGWTVLSSNTSAAIKRRNEKIRAARLAASPEQRAAWGSIGGTAFQKSLTPEQRRAHTRKAGLAWGAKRRAVRAALNNEGVVTT